MHALLRMAATSFAVSTAKRRAKRAVRHGALLVAVSVIAVTGLGFLTAALWIWVTMQSTALIGSLVVGALFLVIAAIVYIMALISNRSDARVGVLAGPADPFLSQPRWAADMNPPSIGNLMAIVGTGYILGRFVGRR